MVSPHVGPPVLKYPTVIFWLGYVGWVGVLNDIGVKDLMQLNK